MNTLYLETLHTLQSFQRVKGVLGGTLLYQNKVIATQLDHNLTKQLVVTDPYRIKLPAQNVATNYCLPLGVQLLVVYVERSELKRLKNEVEELCNGLKVSSNCRKENENKSSVSGITASTEEKNANEVPNLVKDAVRARQIERMDKIIPANFVVRNPPDVKKSQTTDDIPKHTNISIRYYSLGLPAMKSDWCESSVEYKDKPKIKLMRPYYNTICDPIYPLFKSNGLPASFHLYNSRLNGHKPTENLKTRPRPRNIDLKTEVEKPQKAKRQFSLPLNTNTETKPVVSRSIPLTPLMAKLTLLAQEEINLETPISSKAKILKTPITVKTPAFELANCFTPVYEKVEDKLQDLNDEKTEDLVQLVLYVFGFNSTSVLVLIENSLLSNQDNLHNLWEKSMSNLKRLDEKLNKCLDDSPLESSGEYSYAVVDPNWGPIERGGAYQPHQLELLTSLHYTLCQNPSITDITVRGDDTISYGCQCSKMQILYQQNCVANSGVPAPVDIMGTIPTKAKSILEKDHGIILS